MFFRVFVALVIVLPSFALAGDKGASGEPTLPPGFSDKCKANLGEPDPNAKPPRRISGSVPLDARDGSRDNKVWVLITVNEKGRVEDPMLCYTNNSDYAFKYIAAVRKWRYRPATLNGEPIAVKLIVSTTVARKRG